MLLESTARSLESNHTGSRWMHHWSTTPGVHACIGDINCDERRRRSPIPSHPRRASGGSRSPWKGTLDSHDPLCHVIPLHWSRPRLCRTSSPTGFNPGTTTRCLCNARRVGRLATRAHVSPESLSIDSPGGPAASTSVISRPGPNQRPPRLAHSAVPALAALDPNLRHCVSWSPSDRDLERPHHLQYARLSVPYASSQRTLTSACAKEAVNLTGGDGEGIIFSLIFSRGSTPVGNLVRWSGLSRSQFQAHAIPCAPTD